MGDRGWSITELEELDAWHGRPTGDTSDTWSLRLNAGGILLQCPRVITSGIAGICRVAWLPDISEEHGGNGIDSTIIRMEASVLALEPILDLEDDVMLGFYPPTLGSLRYDAFVKTGELENASMMEKLKKLGELEEEGDNDGTEAGSVVRQGRKDSDVNPSENKNNVKTNVKGKDDSTGDSGIEAIRNALRL